ncbi:WYL domain-containing protein [Glutamicibacter soli]|uniref:WYL domain-containing protein n=1 Tax=Glutamicibacter soli TaxID=453836 RepID=UPI003FCF5CF7
MTTKNVIIDYINHRGERSSRRIHPIRIWFGSTEWHPSNRWLLEAHDYARDSIRNFALSDVHGWNEDGALNVDRAKE